MKTAFLFLAIACLSFHYLPKTDMVFTLPENWQEPSFFAEPALADSYKAKVVREVFNRLKNAKGDFRSRKPYLHFVKETGHGVAVALPKSGLIMLEEKGYDICATFGKDSLNALAVFLAHELVHCYEKHDWEEYFAAEFQGTEMTGAVKDNLVEDEIQADYLGGFLARSAGFSPFGLMPEFLDKVYQTYNLSDEKMSGYPPKEERKNIAKQSEAKLKDLLELFETGNYLVALEEYDDALEYYYKVLEDFQSREIYNNLGVLSTLSAMKHFTPLQNKFAYPVELDVQSRLRTGSRGDLSKEYREEKLLEAIDFFEKARQLDAFYPVAYLNEGCAHALLGLSQTEFSDLEWDDAESAAERAIRLANVIPGNEATLADAHVLLGILKALKNDPAAAEGYFGEALKWNPQHFLALANLAVLKGETPAIAAASTAKTGGEETIDGITFKDITLNKDHLKSIVKPDEAHKIRLAVRHYDHSVVLANVSQTLVGGQKTSNNTTFHLTEEGYKGATARGIRIGDSEGEVLEKYSEPAARINLSVGGFLHYKLAEGGLIFQLDGEKKVRRWCVYRQKK